MNGPSCPETLAALRGRRAGKAPFFKRFSSKSGSGISCRFADGVKLRQPVARWMSLRFPANPVLKTENHNNGVACPRLVTRLNTSVVRSSASKPVQSMAITAGWRSPTAPP
jgi:hypothetical protein